MSTISDKLLQLNSIKEDIFVTTKKCGLDTSGRTFSNIHELWSQIKKANYQTKNAIPSDVAVEVIADEGYDALAKVIVEAALNVQPWNVPEGITMFGVTGTMKVEAGTDWPDNLPVTEEEMDEAVQEDDADAPTEDKMVLVDNEGNVTTGYLYNEPDSGLMVYNGTVLPELPADWDSETYPNAIIIHSKVTGRYIFFACRDLPVIRDDGEMQFMYPWQQSSGVVSGGSTDWGEFKLWESGASVTAPHECVVWTNFDILDANGAVWFAASAAPTEYKGFEITHYDPVTTNFKAVGWRRVSKHTTGELAGQITKDDFTRQESGGWNYLKNIRSCTREALYYKGVEVWPHTSQTWSYNGVELPALPAIPATHPYLYIFKHATYYLVACDQPLSAYTADDVEYIGRNGLTVNYLAFWETSGVWSNAGSVETLMDRSAGSYYWANTNVLDESGNVRLSASTPIPV